MSAEGRLTVVNKVAEESVPTTIEFNSTTVEQETSATVAQINTVEFDEASLAAASIEGCGDSFEQLYTHYFPKVRALCMRKIGNYAQAEDIAQEAFAKAFERIADFGGPRHFGGWVGTIAANLCTDYLRRRKPVASVDQMMETESGVPSYEIDPIKNVQRDETARLVRQALMRLDTRQREAIVMHEVRGLSCAAVGQQLGISEVAAESLLARARRRLRKEVTAKAIPADLFGLGGLALLPTLVRAWRRVKASAESRAAWFQAGGNLDAFGGAMLPTLDAAKAAVVVVIVGFGANFGAADANTANQVTDGTVSAASVGFLAVDADDSTTVSDLDPEVKGIDLKVSLDVSSDRYAADVDGNVDVPEGETSGTGSGVGGLNLSADLDGSTDGSTGGAELTVLDENGDEMAGTGNTQVAF